VAFWVSDGTDDLNEWRVRAYERSSPEKLCCLMEKEIPHSKVGVKDGISLLYF
jgi:hypothetical protein